MLRHTLCSIGVPMRRPQRNPNDLARNIPRMRHLSALLSAVTLTLLMGFSSTAGAAPVTWEASGILTHIDDPFGTFPQLVAPLPWTLTTTFDPDAPGFHPPSCVNDPYTFSYGPVTGRFVLGTFVYEHIGSAQVNASLPFLGCGSGGLVQFEFIGLFGGIKSLNGGPTLHGLLLAGYVDTQACDGTLPRIPSPGRPSPPCGQSFGGGLAYLGPNGPERMSFSDAYGPHLVPEPGSLTMMLIAAALPLARRHRGRARPDRGIAYLGLYGASNRGFWASSTTFVRVIERSAPAQERRPKSPRCPNRPCR